MLGLALAVCGFSLQGRVHPAVSGEPIAHALIATTDGLLEAESDSTGRYRLACLPATTRAVRFTRIGFDSRTIEVAAAEGATIRLDIELSALPVTLPSVEVAGRRSPPRKMGFGPSDMVERGTRSFTTDDLSQSPLVGDPDPLLGLPVPDALIGGGPSAGLHVRGGSADQNLT